MMGRRQLLAATPVLLVASVAGDPGTGRALARQGGLPPARPDQRYAPPFPAAVPPGNRNVVRARQVIISGPNEGLFEYIGNPALGNSPILWAVAPGTAKDPSGNTLEASGGLAIARRASNTVQEAIWLDPNTGAVKLGSSFDNGVNYTMAVMQVFNSTPYELAFISPTDRPAASAHSMSVQMVLQTGSASQTTDPGSVVINNGGTGYTRVTPAVLELGSANAAVITRMFAIAAFLDTAARLAVDVNGKIVWGPGNAAGDTDLYRLLANVLATDSIYALGNQAAGIPASQAGFSQLWSDSFTQVHTDRALVTQVNFEGANQAANPGAGGSGAKWFSKSGHALVVSAQTGIGGDTLAYDTERLTMDLSADTATLSNTVATNIPGLATKTVQAQKYKIRARLMVKAVAAAAGTITVNLAGPATSSGGMGNSALDNSNVNNVNQVAGLGSIGYVQTNIGRTTLVTLEGVVTFSAAGVLSVQTKTSAAADTYLVQAGSYWELEPVVAT